MTLCTLSRTVSLSLSPLSIFPPPSSLLSWLQLYVCALGRLQRGALWGDAAAEIRLDPAEERREQVGQQRHPAVPRISGCRAVPPSLPYPPTPHTHTHTGTYILRAPLPHPSAHTNKHYTMSKYKHSNTHKTAIRQYAHVKGLPQWKYCPLKQVCITGIIHAVGECWQKVRKSNTNNYNNTQTYKCCLTKALCWYEVEASQPHFVILLTAVTTRAVKVLQKAEEDPVSFVKLRC